jgi:excisionase family DNA binding protein
MSELIRNSGLEPANSEVAAQPLARITVPVIAQRLGIGRLAVYAMLEQGIIPGIRFGRRWIITRYAYEQWEKTCGAPERAGLMTSPEVPVLN